MPGLSPTQPEARDQLLNEDGPIVALDVGGMSIRSGVVEADLSVHRIHTKAIDHRGTADELLSTMWSCVDACRPRRRVAIAIPGPFDHAAAVSSMVHKFSSLAGLDLREALLARSSAPELDIRFVNDAAAAGAGEVVAADSSPGHTLVLTLGTGLGASLFDGTTLVPSVAGVDIAQLWSTPIDDDTTADERFSATGLAAALAVDTGDLPTATRTAAATSTLAVWGRGLGEFIEALREPLDLQRVIIGGGVAGAFDRFDGAMAAATAVPVRQAALGSSGALLGAAALAFGSS